MRQKRLLILYHFASLFLVSGAAGLFYEIVWERLLALYFGVTMISITLIVSACMAGLGIGYYFLNEPVSQKIKESPEAVAEFESRIEE